MSRKGRSRANRAYLTRMAQKTLELQVLGPKTLREGV
jgi:hypothetical protein